MWETLVAAGHTLCMYPDGAGYHSMYMHFHGYSRSVASL